ncbi:uncharacterized protein LOC120338056 isoform X1 [Styela clava]
MLTVTPILTHSVYILAVLRICQEPQTYIKEMASQRDNQEQTKNSKWSASNYDDATYLYGESEKQSDYEDNDFSTINIAQLTSFGDYSPDRRSLERDAGILIQRYYNQINFHVEEQSDHEDNDFSTINFAQLTSFDGYSSDRRSLERDAGNLDLIVIYSIMKRIRMLEKRIEVMESRLSTAEELRNSEAKTIKHTKMETKVRRSE